VRAAARARAHQASAAAADEVNDQLGRYMRVAYRKVRERAEDLETTMRRAAFAIGIARVAEVAHLRGYV
jgi:glutamate dehydrogenase/leucine dehydrogenase